MDMTKGPVDVSCYLCFEATGDSESPCDPISKDPNIACRIPTCDDDDAQSCCYDTSDQSLCSDELLINGYESSNEDELEMCVYGTTTYKEEDDDDDDCEIQKQKKMSVCVDSGAEKMDEMEKNRLFWEACLAS